MTIKSMLEAHPHQTKMGGTTLSECIAACYECAQACTACADACMGEEQVQMLVRCIRLNLDCADVCDVTGRMLSRQTEPDMAMIRTQLEACAQACRSCGEECAKHGGEHEHCRVCAESCRRCEESCKRLLEAAA